MHEKASDSGGFFIRPHALKIRAFAASAAIPSKEPNMRMPEQVRQLRIKGEGTSK
jgi:hypothetical protein